MLFLPPDPSEGLMDEIKIEEEKSELEYEVVKLVKKTEIRTFNRATFTALKSAHGLEPIQKGMQFKDSLFTSLIQRQGEPTKIKFLIVVAMYNESSEHFVNTMIGVNDNLAYFCQGGVEIEEIACIIIVDGIKPFLESYNAEKDFFSQFFNEDMVKEKFGVSNLLDCKIPNQTNMDEFAHLFMQKITFGGNTLPLQTILCIKQLNKRKLNTHLWFFGGFCEMINPTYVMLLDVGTKPMEGALFYLYEAMHLYPNIAGCCGEIKPMEPSFWKLVAPAQVVEYKFSHMLDKALESLIGYITVLPGAFSAYRWEALKGAPLWEDYFKSICKIDEMNAFNSNIYLAEDRVLCLALVTKKDKNYILRYVKKSVAETDVPSSLSELMAQRRRWINGSWFALIDAILKYKKVFKSNHSCIWKLMFTLQMIYYTINVFYTWFIVGIFFVSYSIALRREYNAYGNTNLNNFGDILIMVYSIILMMIYIVSIAVKPKRVEDFYKLMCYTMGIYQFYVSYLIIKLVLNSGHNTYVIPAFIASSGSFALMVILNCQIINILRGVLHYIFLVPTYINIFLIYSICNIHDCTWGNRPDSLSSEEKQRLEEFEEFRTRWGIIWALSNGLFSYIMLVVSNTDQSSSGSFYYIFSMLVIGGIILIIRFCGGMVYFFLELCKKSIKEKSSVPDQMNFRGTTRIVYNKRLGASNS